MPGAKKKIEVEHHSHRDETRTNIPPAEAEPDISEEKKKPVPLEYERSIRNTELDPQLVWLGKDEQDQTNLTVMAPPIYGQEKIHPRVLIEDLICQSQKEAEAQGTLDLFGDFNGLDDPNLRHDYYNHDQNWSNRMILGDSLQVMASLAGREGYRGKVQCIYIDPPYGFGFNSNFQWSTNSKNVKDGNAAHITREPEQVKAFQDTWRRGIHSYLTYLRDRLIAARELLTTTGSLFFQISNENVHFVRTLMGEVFGEENFIGLIWFRKKTMPLGDKFLENMGDYIIWFAKDSQSTKFRRLLRKIQIAGDFHWNWRQTDPLTRVKLSRKELADEPPGNPVRLVSMWPPSYSEKDSFSLPFKDKQWAPPSGQCYPTSSERMERIAKAGRLEIEGNYLRYVMKLSDDSTTKINLNWGDTIGARGQRFVTETSPAVIQRCILMTTDPGDIVLDPTCGSGTTAYVAEQWGRRWITIDTSRVALALARTRIMAAQYPKYLLLDSKEGQEKEAQLMGKPVTNEKTYGNISRGFVYERVPKISLSSIANNSEIDVIWENYQKKLQPLQEELNHALGTAWQEWEIPQITDNSWSEKAKTLHNNWLNLRIALQSDIDESITSTAEFEHLYDRPFEDKSKIRVAGPFTVESLSPHRLVVAGDIHESNSRQEAQTRANRHLYEADAPDFAKMIIENLRISGVQQANKEDKIEFSAISGWAGDYICAEGQYTEGETDKRAALFVGPEFGTIGQADLNAAAREAGRGKFDVLISCGFSYDAHASEINRFADMPILKARLSQELRMSTDLKNTGHGNLFVIFGEPDIEVTTKEDDNLQVSIKGVDIYDPSTGQVRSDDTDRIACWFIDTDYNEESFFVKQAYFLGASDPYKTLKTTLKAEIDQEAWASLNSEVSRPFPKPTSGRIAVKVINHLGDEAMKVIKT